MDNGMVMKKCKVCGEEKEINEFPYKYDKRKAKGKTIDYLCKKCKSLRDKEYHKSRREIDREQARKRYKAYKALHPPRGGKLIKKELHDKGLKRCSVCNEIKPLSEYSMKKNIYMEYSECRECRNKKAWWFYYKHWEEQKQRHVLYGRKHADQRKKYREINENKVKELVRRWKLNNRLYIIKNKQYHRDLLSDEYIKSRIQKSIGLGSKNISPDLIRNWREQIKIKRLINQLKKKNYENP
jgi:hypothetical protein